MNSALLDFSRKYLFNLNSYIWDKNTEIGYDVKFEVNVFVRIYYPHIIAFTAFICLYQGLAFSEMINERV